jgi:hypothetical protein
MANTGTEHALMVVNKHLMNAAMELGGDLDTVSKQQAFAENIVRGLKNPDMSMNGGEVTMERVQVMETGEIRLKPPEPAPITETCVQEPGKNGKKDSKELVNAS